MSESSSYDEVVGLSFYGRLKRMKENDPRVKSIISGGDDLQNMTDEEYEELGRDICNNSHLTKVDLACESLNDHDMSCLFRGLTKSNTINELNLEENGFGIAAVRSMVPFLQNANNLTHLDLADNNLQTEGFHMLLRALSDSPIEDLWCQCNGIESVDIDSEHIPKHWKKLFLYGNSINANGCRGLAKLLQGGSTLEELHLENNKIDDDGVEILVEALKSNRSLTHLDLTENEGISKRGQIMLLKLVNDISSIDATLQSNHTLEHLHVECNEEDEQIQMRIDSATDINWNEDSPGAAGRAKVIQTQLHSERRAQLAELQGVDHSVYSEIDPIHLPEVFALVGRHHGQRELYLTLRSSIAEVISTVNREQYLKQQRAELKSKLEAIEAEIATIEAAKEQEVGIGSEAPIKDVVSSDDGICSCYIINIT